jgi:hypothetical protein
MPAKSLAQAQMMGMAHAMQKGKMAPTPGPAAKVAVTMKPSDVTDFASTPQAGLPKRVKAPAAVNVGGPGPGRPALKMKNVGKPVKKMKFM